MPADISPSYARHHGRVRHFVAVSWLVGVWIAIRIGAKIPELSTTHWRLLEILGGVACGVAWLSKRPWWAMLVLCGVGVCIGSGAWWATPHSALGECDGVVRIVTDPVVRGSVTRAIVKRGHVRYSASAYGRSSWKLRRVAVGESVHVRARCTKVRTEMKEFERSRHVMGLMSIGEVSELVNEASPLQRSTGRIRDALRRGVASFGAGDRELFMGLVVGADERQSPHMIDEFRRSGLGHLTAVSGQNVSYVLTCLALVISGWRTSARLAMTLAVLLWFVVLTRFEPSVVRATAMAGAGVVMAAHGRRWNARLIGPTSMTCVLLCDPLLAFSVGFQLSASAALGLLFLQAPIRDAFGRHWWSESMAVTLSAQLATVPIALGVFHRLPIVSLVANLCATPVAGAVMLLGLPLGVIGSFLPSTVSTVLMLPCRIMVRWVWWVAHLARSVPSHTGVDVVLWLTVCGWLAWRGRSRGTDMAGLNGERVRCVGRRGIGGP